MDLLVDDLVPVGLDLIGVDIIKFFTGICADEIRTRAYDLMTTYADMID